MRPIDADAMIEDLLTVNPQYKDVIDFCVRITKAQPTFNTKLKGEWDIQYDMEGKYGICSVCGMDTDFTHYGKAYKICPHCGADMRESGDSE